MLNPFPSYGREWHEIVWKDIIDEHYGLIDKNELMDKYRGKYVVSKIAITSPQVLRKFKTINEGVPYEQQIKPFNFFLVGAHNSHLGVDAIKPIAPFNRNSQVVVHQEFIDYNSGKVMKGSEHWKSMDSMFFSYANHKETKFDGDKGLLARKHLRIKSWVYIGKESNHLEETEVMGVTEEDYITYRPSTGPGSETVELNEIVMSIQPSDGVRLGISKRHIIRMQKAIQEGDKTIKYNRKTKAKLQKSKRYTGKKNG